jgi:hypothetical protein
VRVGRFWLPDLLGTFTAYRIDDGHVLVGFAMSWIDFAVSVDQRIGIVRRRKSIETDGWVGRPAIKKIVALACRRFNVQVADATDAR